MKRGRLERVLYVDDEPDIREVVELSLGLNADLKVHTCGSGETALQLVHELRPDMILLDVMMPGLDGPSTLRKLREMPDTAHVPVVFMTAKALPQEIERFLTLGAVAVIPKPFDPLSLADQVANIWENLHHG